MYNPISTLFFHLLTTFIKFTMPRGKNIVYKFSERIVVGDDCYCMIPILTLTILLKFRNTQNTLLIREKNVHVLLKMKRTKKKYYQQLNASQKRKNKSVSASGCPSIGNKRISFASAVSSNNSTANINQVVNESIPVEPLPVESISAEPVPVEMGYPGLKQYTIDQDMWDINDDNDDSGWNDILEPMSIGNSNVETAQTQANTQEEGRKERKKNREKDLNDAWNENRDALRDLYLESVTYGLESSGSTDLRKLPDCACKKSFKRIRVFYAYGKPTQLIYFKMFLVNFSSLFQYST